MNTHRKMVLSSVMAALLASLTVGCDGAQQRESEQVKAGESAETAYSVNGSPA